MSRFTQLSREERCSIAWLHEAGQRLVIKFIDPVGGMAQMEAQLAG